MISSSNGHPTPPETFPAGTSPGTEVSPVILARELEVCSAQRDRALELLASLERILHKVGGYMEHDDQTVLREARGLLAECGKMTSLKVSQWKDRP